MTEITVILADDHTLVRKGIRAMLESDEDIRVVAEAENGLQALEKSREFRPNLLVMDVRMPLMTGLEACQLMPDYAPGTKVLILSMHDSEDYVLQSLKAGAWGYLLKDIDRSEFLKALRQVNAGHKYFSGAVSSILAEQLLKPAGLAGTGTGGPSRGIEKTAGAGPAGGPGRDSETGQTSGPGRADGPGQTSQTGQASDRTGEAGGSTAAAQKEDPYGLTRREKEILHLVINGNQNKQIAESLGKSVRTIETHRFNIMKKLGVNNAVDMVNKVTRENLI